MPKLKCICGHSINLSEIPNRNGFHLWSESRFDEIIDNASRSVQAASSEDAAWTTLRRLFLPPIGTPSPHVYQCVSCGRLAVLRHASDLEVAQWYRPENLDSHPALLASLEKSLSETQ
jgi:hypothetical protein